MLNNTQAAIGMSKMMSLEHLSSIRGAESSEAVEKLFEAIKNAKSSNSDSSHRLKNTAVELDDLRNDEVIESSEDVKKLIRQNFPMEKNGYLVVAKVIEE